MDISVVVPLYNEEESLPELFAWIERVMKAHDFSYEVIFVNDGSTDRSWQIIEQLQTKSDKVRGIKFRRNYGKSPALYCGFEQAQGDVVITMDADLQDSPDEIPELYRMITEDGYDLVSGWKQKRYDPLSKTIPTKLFNATARKVSGIKEPARFQLRLESLSQRCYKKHRSVRRNASLYPLSGKECRFQEDWRESRTPSGTEIWQDKIRRVESFLQRIPGLDIPLVPFHLRHQAYALLWHIGFADVLRRIRCRHYCRRQQAVLHESRDALPPCDRFSLFLPVTDIHDYRHAVICGRFSRRADIPQCTRTQ